VLGRYVNSRNQEINRESDGIYRDPDARDIRMIPIGAEENKTPVGQIIEQSEYMPWAVDGYVNCTNTVYHNMMEVGNDILNNGKIGLNFIRENKRSFLSETINNKIINYENFEHESNPEANAGGRSLSANLDGSIEMSIGADTIDRKSLTIDFAGGVISHVGRDKNGISHIHQTDGDVIIQVGGNGVEDERFTEPSHREDRPGRIEIHLNRPGTSSQKIIIDENGMTFDIQGNIAMKSSGDFTVSAGGTLLLDGETIYTYGSFDDAIDGTRKVIGKENYITRTGRKV
jgi:hypothetical protein